MISQSLNAPALSVNHPQFRWVGLPPLRMHHLQRPRLGAGEQGLDELHQRGDRGHRADQCGDVVHDGEEAVCRTGGLDLMAIGGEAHRDGLDEYQIQGYKGYEEGKVVGSDKKG